jgi:hypothetical protein
MCISVRRKEFGSHWGDKNILENERRFEIELAVGKAISAVASSLNTNLKADMPGFH